MKAVVLREVGGPLGLEEVPEPEGGSVVDVRAAGVNFADILMRRGMYPQMPELPHVLGNEVAGDLDGKRVLALPRAAVTPSVSTSIRSGRSRCPTTRRTPRAHRS